MRTFNTSFMNSWVLKPKTNQAFWKSLDFRNLNTTTPFSENVKINSNKRRWL